MYCNNTLYDLHPQEQMPIYSTLLSVRNNIGNISHTVVVQVAQALFENYYTNEECIVTVLQTAPEEITKILRDAGMKGEFLHTFLTTLETA